MKTQTLLGTGLYSLPEAARYLRVPAITLRRWTEGYTFTSGTRQKRHSSSVLPGQPFIVDGETVITFADLIELQFVQLFRKHGVSMAVIRAAAARAAQMFETDHPFNVHRFQTDGRRIFAEIDPSRIEEVPRERIVQDMTLGQTVIGPIAQIYFRKLDYDNDKVSRWWPIGKDSRVVLDPERNFGKPTDAASSVPLHPLYRMVRTGESIEAVAHWYDVDVEAVEAALQFESDYLLKAA